MGATTDYRLRGGPGRTLWQCEMAPRSSFFCPAGLHATSLKLRTRSLSGPAAAHAAVHACVNALFARTQGIHSPCHSKRGMLVVEKQINVIDSILARCWQPVFLSCVISPATRAANNVSA